VGIAHPTTDKKRFSFITVTPEGTSGACGDFVKNTRPNQNLNGLSFIKL
jgi:hypothetical protein